MSLTIELNEPEMAALAEIAQAEGREPSECASHILHTHLAPMARQLSHSSYESGVSPLSGASADLLNEMQNGEPPKLLKSQIQLLKGKYSHLDVSSDMITADRRAEVERDEADFEARFKKNGDHS